MHLYASDSQRMDCGRSVGMPSEAETNPSYNLHTSHSSKSRLLFASFCYSAGKDYWEDQTGICSSQGNGPGVHRWSGDYYRRPCHARLCGDTCTSNGCKVCGGGNSLNFLFLCAICEADCFCVLLGCWGRCVVVYVTHGWIALLRNSGLPSL